MALLLSVCSLSCEVSPGWLSSVVLPYAHQHAIVTMWGVVMGRAASVMLVYLIGVQIHHDHVCSGVCRGAGAAAVVFDITSSESFAKAQYWVSELQKNASADIGEEEPLHVLCFHKTSHAAWLVQDD